MTTEETPKENLLYGKSEFIGWYIKINALLEDKGYLDDDGKIKASLTSEPPTINYEKKCYNFIVSRLSNSIAGKLSCPQTGSGILKFLQENYGEGNAYELKTKYNEFKMMSHHNDALKYLEIINGFKTKAMQAGAKIYPRDEFKKLVDDVNPQFYLEYIRNTRLKYQKELELDSIKDEDIQEIRKYFLDFFKATPKLLRERSQIETAMKTDGIFIKRTCNHCKEKFGKKSVIGKKIKIYETHNTLDCRIKNNENNKEESEIYFDTCSSTHFVKKVPNTINQSKSGYVRGSTGHSTRIIGNGNFFIGKTEIEASIAPGLDANLISGGKLINTQHIAILRKSKDGKDLKIYKDNKNLKINISGDLISTGTINDNNMIVINAPLTERTWKTTLSCDIGHQYEKKKCLLCMEASQRQKNTSKGKGRDYEVLEKISIDTQGPFSIKGIDGSRYNLKIVDSNSKYISTILMPNKTSETTSNIIDYYIKRTERQTGKRLKKIATDGGTEFYGAFLDTLEKEGIQKVRGGDYEHSFPPDAENANRIINNYARKNLLYSKLPKSYWPYAIMEGTYRCNRTGNPSRAEKFFQRKFRTDHLRPFGSICFAYIQKEKRNFKFDPVRRRCRLLGYADDEEVETMDGYILLDEKTREIIYSKDVVFSNELPIPLPESEDSHLDDLYILNDNEDEDWDYSPSIQDNTDLSGDTITENFSPNSGIDMNQENIDNQFTEIFSPSNQIDMNQETIDNQFTETRPRRRATMFNRSYNNEIDYNEDSDNEYAALSTEIFPNMFELNYRTAKTDPTIPKNYHQMLQNQEKDKWMTAIDTEMNNMINMGVWKEGDIVNELPSGQRAIDSTWVFTKKDEQDGKTEKFKARLCGRGFREIYGIDYEEVFAPTVRQKVVRVICSIAAHNEWKLFSDDMKAAYLNVILKEGRWIKLPDGRFVKINRALYGLKESARLWFQMFRDFLISIKFVQSKVEPCVFTRGKLITAIFVDDTLTTGPANDIQEFRKALHAKFKISKDGGICKNFLSIHMDQGKDGIKLCQNQYLQEKLEMFKDQIHENPYYQVASPLLPNFQEILLKAEQSDEVEPSFPYREMVGSLGYLSNGTRFDITAALSIVSRFCNNPKKLHCNMVRRIFQYLRGCRSYLFFPYKMKLEMNGFCDSSHGNLEDYTSLAGYCFKLGESMITWRSHKEPIITLSTAESEYIALTPAVQECIWLQQLLQEIGYKQETPIIYEDNQPCISLVKNPQEKSRTRHIQIKYHWIREQLKNGVFKIIYIPTNQQDADIFTKGMHGPQIRTICQKLRLCNDSVKKGES